mmetsp:Transcript_3056/g.9316  ORF Transcript_3056/g.9316 Transcript_3056/m.9316 type:complete len:191 (-) Transcript_3056:495-1067(-)
MVKHVSDLPLTSSAYILVFLPRLTSLACALREGRRTFAHRAIRRCIASTLYALATLPKQYSTKLKEHALRHYAQQTSSFGLNGTFALYQLGAALIVVPFSYTMALVASRLYANLQSENHTQMALGALLRTRGTEYFLSLMLSLPCPFERQILLTLVNSFLMQVSCSAAVIPESRGYPHINSVHPRQDLHW